MPPTLRAVKLLDETLTGRDSAPLPAPPLWPFDTFRPFGFLDALRPFDAFQPFGAFRPFRFLDALQPFHPLRPFQALRPFHPLHSLDAIDSFTTIGRFEPFRPLDQVRSLGTIRVVGLLGASRPFESLTCAAIATAAIGKLESPALVAISLSSCVTSPLCAIRIAPVNWWRGLRRLVSVLGREFALAIDEGGRVV